VFKKSTCWYLQLTQDGGAAQPATSIKEGALEAAQEHIEDVVLHSTNQFYKWHSELEAAFASETEEKYKQYAAELQGRLDSCAEILGKASSAVILVSLQVPCHIVRSLAWHAGGCCPALLCRVAGTASRSQQQEQSAD